MLIWSIHLHSLSTDGGGESQKSWEGVNQSSDGNPPIKLAHLLRTGFSLCYTVTHIRRIERPGDMIWACLSYLCFVGVSKSGKKKKENWVRYGKGWYGRNFIMQFLYCFFRIDGIEWFVTQFMWLGWIQNSSLWSKNESVSMFILWMWKYGLQFSKW